MLHISIDARLWRSLNSGIAAESLCIHGPEGVKKQLCLCYAVSGRETALCLVCYEKLICVLRLISSGTRPSQWQKESLHSAVPSAKELQRGYTAFLHEKNSRATKHLSLYLQCRVKRSLLKGVQFLQPLALIGLVKNKVCCVCVRKVYKYIFNLRITMWKKMWTLFISYPVVLF